MNIKRRVFVMAVAIVCSAATFAQSYMKLSNVTVRKAMTELKQKSGYSFVYEQQDLDTNRKITVSANTPQEAIQQILQGQDVRYEIKGKNVVVAKATTIANAHYSPDNSKQQVQGCVKDQNGDPIIGVTVKERGTGNGIATDINGNFTLYVNSGAMLEISYIGYQSQIIAAASNMDIRMNEDNTMLDDVVVVGYGTQKRINLTGAVGSVTGEEMTKRPIVNAANMLQGQVPGLRVVQASGQPGAEGTSFRIRGQGTYSSAGSDPLILINGVPGSLSTLDPSIIESVSVLKDAASASIYGSRAANGVVLVTTKKGSSTSAGKNFSATYSGNFAFYSPTRMLKTITNSAEYMEYYNLAKTNSQQAGFYDEKEISAYRNGGGSEQYPNFDWLDYMFHSSFVQTHNLSLNGNTDNTTYNIALNIVDQPGSLRGFDYKKYNFSFDLTSQITDWLKVGTYISANHGNRKGPRNGAEDAFLCILSQAPTFKPVLSGNNGETKYAFAAYPNVEQSNKNMMAMTAYGIIARNKSYDLNGQFYVDITPIKGLRWHTKLAGRLYDNKLRDWSGTKVPLYNYHTGDFVRNMDLGGGFIPGFQTNDAQTIYTNLYSLIDYIVPFVNRNHNLNVMAGYSQEQNTDEYLWAKRRDYQFDLHELSAGSEENMENEGYSEKWALRSCFFRLNYDYMGKYLFEANARYDGSSRISSEKRWGWFPSFSAGYRLTEEKFVKDLNANWLSNLKIRGSWGQLGNQNIGLYPYQAIVDLVDSYSFNNSTLTQGVAQTRYTNRDLKWEKTTIADIGADITLFDRFNITFDWYSKKTSDILRYAQVSSFIGLDPPMINNGEMLNKGWEVAISWNDIVRNGSLRNLQYNVGVYFDHSKNELTKFGEEEIGHHSILREGIPYNSFYMLDCIGVFADEDDVKNSPKQFNDRTQSGDLKYRDTNNDGVVNNDDRIVIDGRFPKLEYSFNAAASWKDFDLSVMFQGVAGKKIYVGAYAGVTPFSQGSMITEDYVKGMWTEDNPYGAAHPRLYYADMGGTKNRRANSYFLRNGSYLRMKNLQIGYTLPKTLTRRLAIERLRFYFSGDNLLTFTPYDGLDPENNLDGSFLSYPQNRIISFGINVEF